MQIDNPWALKNSEILQNLEVRSNRGLTSTDVQDRLLRDGPNQILGKKPPTVFEIFYRQFKSLLVLLLAFAAAVAAIAGDYLDAFAILLVLIINSSIGFFTEWRAIKSMDALRKMGQAFTRALRDGEQCMVPADQLVAGDILLLEAGDVVAADGRILESHNLSVDESTLTGESVPVEKSANLLLEELALVSERQNMVMKGTHITRGTCVVVVTSTGMNTELGKIASLTSSAEDEVTPLERKLDRLGGKLLWVALGVSAFILAGGLLSGKDPLLMLETAIALAVATVPEGLPIVATIALAKGLWTMAQRNALVDRLSAVETLGATSIIVTDKTGTLTENRMTVSEVLTSDGIFSVLPEAESEKLRMYNSSGDVLFYNQLNQGMKKMIEVLALCNDAKVGDDVSAIGDPMEVALLRFSLDVLNQVIDLEKTQPRISEVPFDSESKMMATLQSGEEGRWVAVKGAPESVITSCLLSSEQKDYWIKRNDEMAEKGLRVLAVAYKVGSEEMKSVYEGLSFLGLIGLIDPARQDVPASIAKCQRAGIRIIMATGDQGGTATKIAEDIGLAKETLRPITGRDLLGPWTEEIVGRLRQTSIISRVSPEQKLQLVAFLQKQGAVVAMTGDGVNDAPALKKADIGVAMGLRGTQVARESSDMVLKDDRFETIVFAVQQGRVIFSNIRQFVIYLLSCNISEIFVIGLAAIFSEKLPVTPLQILFLNLVTDVFPALALGMGQGDDTYLQKPPRRYDEKIIENEHWKFIFFYGFLITLTVLSMFYISQQYFSFSHEKAVTLSFLTLGFSQVFHVFNLRKYDSNVLFNEITKNPFVWGAITLCIGLFVLSVQVPVFATALSLDLLTSVDWLVVVGASLLPWVGQLFVRVR